MVIQRPAAARAARGHHFHPQARQQTDGGFVDAGCEHLLRATRQQCHARAPDPQRGMHRGGFNRAGRRDIRGRQSQHGTKSLGQHALAGNQTAQRPRQTRTKQRRPEQPGPGQYQAQHRPECPLRPGTAIGLFDIGARMIDQMHVVHAGGARGHAGQARQAAIDVADDLFRRRPVRFQHVLDQVNAPARTIEFVAQQHEGRTGGGAKSTMHAGPQDLVG